VGVSDRRWVWLPARVLGAFSLLAVGAVHLHEYDDLYSAIPTIGTLFGFMEPGYNPAAIRAAQVSEIVTEALLGIYLVARHVPIRSAGRRPAVEPTTPQEVRT
jgi:hypothetical protein